VREHNGRQAKTDWAHEGFVTIEGNADIAAEITSKVGRDGHPFYSVKLGRKGERDGEQFIYPYFHEEDLVAVPELAKKALEEVASLPH